MKSFELACFLNYGIFLSWYKRKADDFLEKAREEDNWPQASDSLLGRGKLKQLKIAKKRIGENEGEAFVDLASSQNLKKKTLR